VPENVRQKLEKVDEFADSKSRKTSATVLKEKKRLPNEADLFLLAELLFVNIKVWTYSTDDSTVRYSSIVSLIFCASIDFYR
jgi:hypothetical protein